LHFSADFFSRLVFKNHFDNISKSLFKKNYIIKQIHKNILEIKNISNLSHAGTGKDNN
jgi:hypothetical protein